MVLRGLLVGVSYGGTRYELAGCASDVASCRAFLTARGAVKITTLDDSLHKRGDELYPSRTNVLRALAVAVRETASGDRLFAHFSGHGFQFATTGSVFTKAGTTIDPATSECLLLRHTAATPGGKIGVNNTICAREIVQVLATTPPGAHVFLSVDACAAGEMFDLAYNLQSKGTRAHQDLQVRRNPGRDAFDADVVVVTAVRDHKFAWDVTEDGVAFGIFTKFLLGILDDARRAKRPLTNASLLHHLQLKLNTRKNLQDPSMALAHRDMYDEPVWLAE